MKKILMLFGLLLLITTLVSCGDEETPDEKTYYSVVFVTNTTDVTVESQNIESGKGVTNPVINRDGYELEGWYYDNATFMFKYNFENSKVVASISLYAKWKAVAMCTIKFNSNDGSKVDDLKVRKDSTPSAPTVPKKDGYIFNGWYIDEDLNNEFIWQTPISEDIMLHASWIEVLDENSIYVNFVTNSSNSIETQIITIGNKVSKPDDLIKTGAIFVGWFTDSTCLNAFNFDTILNTSTTLYAKWVTEDTKTYFVNFNTNGGTYIPSQNIYENSVATKPINPKKNGSNFAGWYIDSGLTNSFTFDTLITGVTTLYAKWNAAAPVDAKITSYGSYNESLYAEFADSNPSACNAYYKLSTSSTWIKVDNELLRVNSDGKVRVDVIGIKAGNYDLKVTTSSGQSLEIPNIETEEYDRSGYAHFNYTSGIGAYKDDGTLKDGAIVVYVNDINKNTITIPGVGQTGIGWILNNAQYTKKDSKGNPCNTYSLTQDEKSITYLEKPLNIRIIGKVTPPSGLTAYNSTNEGGTVGDNGFMARMKDCSNITIEGVGEDAQIYGWGIHFMAATAGKGESFEVRNITFDKYPEDALGMEGVQENGVLSKPVQRCWIHNNSFLPGYCAKPAESDKAEGDGSCDFKRGLYFTLSYNYFTSAHKTNLVGASDDNMQYNLTMHHNYWNNCGSRLPLARMGNIHMYNNLFETTDDCKTEMSVVQDIRAKAYVFSEANFFHGSKNPTKLSSSGVVKSYMDVKYSCFGTDGSTVVSDRNAAVTSANKYPNFDTNSALFYYDTVTKTSKVKRLTDAVTAKAECMAFSGVNKQSSVDYEKIKINTTTPVLVTSDTVVNTATKINKGESLFVFTINTEATFIMTSTNTSVPPVLVNIYGERMFVASSNATSVTLKPGTYVIESSITHSASKGTSQAKESSLTSYSITFK